MSRKNVFISGVSSDIGCAMARFFLQDGANIIGTYRNIGTVKDLINNPCCFFIECDIGDKESVKKAINQYKSLLLPWDIFISAVGTTEPIGKFFTLDFDIWEQSVIINSTAQLRMLHALYQYRRKDQICHVVFFAGGGTNNPFTSYSAYCVSKILLIKMCELLDDEDKNLNPFIIGPGWVRTKIHDQTINNPHEAGENFKKVMKFIDSEQSGTPMEDIFDCINWCIARGREISGGRNFSVVHDLWQKDGILLARQLKENRDKFKLRRENV